MSAPKDPYKYDDWIKKKRHAALKQWRNKESRNNILNSLRSEETRKKKSDISKEMWKSEEHRSKIKKIYSNQEYKKKISKIEKDKWNDHDFKEKMLKIFRSKEYRSKQQKNGIERWKNQNYRNLMECVLADHKKKLSSLACRTIQRLYKKYPLFSQIEEMKYNPNKPKEKEIQVRCKNHNCPNSKEKDGWFTPTGRQIEMRINAIENIGKDNSYFYCCQECKNECPLYNSKGADPFKEIETPYNQEEYNIWRKKVLKQDNYECQKCGAKENLNCHHIIPVKLEVMFSLDPDNGIVLCENCHYKYGHKTGTECSTGKLSKLDC